MAYDFRAQRLFADMPLEAGAIIEPARAHYLLNVMRLKVGDAILVFNGRDGEWRAVADLLRRGGTCRQPGRRASCGAGRAARRADRTGGRIFNG